VEVAGTVGVAGVTGGDGTETQPPSKTTISAMTILDMIPL
jgi:hypothetical protein